MERGYTASAYLRLLERMRTVLPGLTLTTDIIATVKQLRANGVEFLTVPPSYYDALAARIKAAQALGEPTETVAGLLALPRAALLATLILTGPTAMPAAALDEVKRLALNADFSGRTVNVYVLGGTAAVSTAVDPLWMGRCRCGQSRPGRETSSCSATSTSCGGSRSGTACT